MKELFNIHTSVLIDRGVKKVRVNFKKDNKIVGWLKPIF